MKKKKKATKSRRQQIKPKSSISLNPNQQFLVCAAILILLIVGYFYTIVFEGKQPFASDTLAWRGNAQSIIEAREKFDSNPLWANNVFAGMPTYLISLSAPFKQPVAYIIQICNKILNWRATYFIIGALGIILLMRFWHFSAPASMLAAIAFIWSPYLFGLLDAGHNTKVRTIMLLPLIMFTFLKLLKKPGLLNAALFTILFSLGIQASHYQIIFYTILVLVAFGGHHLFSLLRQKDLRASGLLSAFVVGSLLVALGISSFPALTVHEYTKYSTRGGSEDASSSGLSYDYATSWSLYPGEMMTFLIPRFYGGSSTEQYEGNAVPQLKGRTIPGYWGKKPFTSTTDYIGVIPFFFAAIALIFSWRDSRVLVLLAIIALSLFISFGKHFSPIYDLFFNFVPFFDKFRVPSMILVLVQFSVAILAGFGFEFIYTAAKEKISLEKILKITAVIFGIFIFLGLTPFLLKSSISLTRADELSRYQPELLSLIKEARYDMLKQDAIRFLILVSIAFALTAFYLKKSAPKVIFFTGTLLLLIFDLFGISNRYMQNLVKTNEIEQHFAETATDKFLTQDQSMYRIFPLGKLYGDNRWSYRHQSIGGYHPAKLRLIQDINESNLYAGTDPAFENNTGLPINWNVVNMLNTKYILAQGLIDHPNLKRVFEDNQNNIIIYENQSYLPRVFAVGKVEIIKDKQKRLARLNDPGFEPANNAILEKEPGTEIGSATNFSSAITRYEPNQIDIEVETDTQTLLVLSEMYYPAGWRAFIDGEETEIYKTNHALRSIVVSEGSHKIEFRFQPRTYLASLWIMGSSTILVYLILGISLIYEFRYKRIGEKEGKAEKNIRD